MRRRRFASGVTRWGFGDKVTAYMISLRGYMLGVMWLGVAGTLVNAADQTSVQPGRDASGALVDGPPFVKSWVPAEFPKNLPARVKTGSADERLVIDEKGAVTAVRTRKASAPEFGEAALAAVKQWTFSPGVDGGKYAPMCVDISFWFNREKKQEHGPVLPESMMPRLVRRTPAELEDGPLGDTPPTLVGRGLPGAIAFQCTVDADGKASHPVVLRASHADYVPAVLASFPSWRFTPATQGDLKVSSTMVGEVTYSDSKTPSRSAVLEANGLTLADASAPDAQPQPMSMADPVWPYDLLLKGQGGTADVAFTVQPNGAISDVVVKSASDPAFGDAVVAAVETWQFQPAIVDGRGVEAHLIKHAVFTPAKDGDDSWLGRLVARVRSGAVGGGRGLDAPITPVYRIPPIMPDSAAAGTKSTATVEFVIDVDGRARLPRIVAASTPAFGWAAATAVSQWVFTPPTRGGKPTEVRVQIPFQL